MWRRLADAEMARLQTALEQDGIEITSFHEFAWQRGWLLPPFSFLPLTFNSPVHFLLAICVGLCAALPEISSIIIALTIAAGAIWVFDSPQAQRRFTLHRRAVVFAGIICVTLLGWYRWAPPVYWPAAAHWLTILYVCAIIIGLKIAFNIVAHYRSRKRPERRRWASYVERVVSIEAF